LLKIKRVSSNVKIKIWPQVRFPVQGIGQKSLIYQTAKKDVDLRVRFEGETVWLKQDEIAKLYSKERSVITNLISD
jgi:hypothetical protein